jgi:hypothetical protein
MVTVHHICLAALLEGSLAHGVKAEESTWTLDAENNVINITLFKVHRMWFLI